MNKQRLVVAAAAASATITANANANVLKEIVVTSQKRPESLQLRLSPVATSSLVRL
jgi:hypothetical protein